jgi:AraC family transcriptional regulator
MYKEATMPAILAKESVTTQFGLAQGPTLLAQRRMPRPIAFSRLRATEMSDDRTSAAPRDTAFVFLVATAPAAAGEIWVEGVHDALPPAHPGDTFVFDLRTSPVARFAGPYEFVRFHLPTVTLDRLADDQGFPRVQGLATTPPQVRDPVMQGLAQSLLPVLEAPSDEAIRFVDSIALAFHAHIVRRYGEMPPIAIRQRPALAPWQVGRVRAFVDANLDTRPSVAELARVCGISPSHFSRGFSGSVGVSPHKWLMTCRMERAKDLLLGGREALSQIALACGFVDQSHFTRAFTRREGQSPGQWQRRHRKESFDS